MVRLQLDPTGRVGEALVFGSVVSFWVGNAGLASFQSTISPLPLQSRGSYYTALYRASEYLKSELGTFGVQLELVDYANERVRDGGAYRFDAYVEPGMYVLVAKRTSRDGGAALVSHQVDLPDYDLQRAVIDPNSGDMLGVLRGVDRAKITGTEGDGMPGGSSLGLVESYRSSYWRVVTPPGSLDGTMALALNLTCPAFHFSEQSFPRQAALSVWQAGDNRFVRFGGPDDFLDPPQADPVTDPDCQNGQIGSSHPSVALVRPTDGDAPLIARPFDEFIVALDRRDLASKIAIESYFDVPESGSPDLAVESIAMLPNNGETKVRVTVTNRGFSPASLTHSQLAFTGYEQPADINEFSLAPFASRTRTYPWTPLEPSDQVSYQVDVDNVLDEPHEDDNALTRVLSEVDAFHPTVSIQLANPARDGQAGPVWGRYISKVPGVVSDIILAVHDPDTPADTDHDGIADEYRAQGDYPNPSFNQGRQFQIFGPEPTYTIPQFDLGMLFPTTNLNTNEITLIATDRYGLKSELAVQDINVQPSLGWLQGSGSGITFDAANNQYDMTFHNDLVQWPDDPGLQTINGLLGANIPFVGKKKNRFLLEVDSESVASLDPAQPVNAPVTAHLLAEVLGETVFDEVYGGEQQVNEHVTVLSDLIIDPATLDAQSVNVGALFTDYEIPAYQSPEITLFSYGVPGVASINANLQIGVDLGINAGATIALDPAVIQDILNPPIPLGVAPPTFVQPSATLSAQVAGEIEVIGIDLAELSGGVQFTLAITFGLDGTDASEVVPFDDFLTRSCVALTGQFGLLFEAHLLGIEVWDTEVDFPQFDIASSCDHGIKTHDGVVGAPGLAAIAGGELPPFADAINANGGTAVTNPIAGTDPVGTVAVDPHPVVAIDPVSKQGIYAQVIDADPAPSQARGQLAFSLYDDGNWTPLDGQTLMQPEHLGQPELALTHDQSDEVASAVLVYQAVSPPIPGTTVNQYLSGQQLHSRYYDGKQWSMPQTLSTADGMDGYASLAFNQQGDGVVAWVRNTNVQTPIDQQGSFDRSANEIVVARWDGGQHRWTSPHVLTSNAVADGQPSTFVDQDGRLYVAWVTDAADGNDVVASVYSQQQWSPPTSLPTIGLPVDGRIEQLALGSTQAGRVDLLIAYSTVTDEQSQSVQSVLWNRSTPAEQFLQPAYLETVAENSTFYHLRTHQSAAGMTVYWQRSDGVQNDVYVTRRGSNGVWLPPSALTYDPTFEFAPSLAIDEQDVFVLVYEQLNVPGPDGGKGEAGPAAADDNEVGPPTAAGAISRMVEPLPELRFTSAANFGGSEVAPSGNERLLASQLTNLGMAETDVIVQFFDEIPGEQSTPTEKLSLHLASGQQRDLYLPVAVQPGPRTYCVTAMAVDTNGQPRTEAISGSDNLTCSTIEGLPDLVLDAITLSDAAPHSGDSVVLTAEVRNNSSETIVGTKVDFYVGDPTAAGGAAQPLASQAVPSLGAGESTIVQAVWQVPEPGDAQYQASGGPGGNGIGLGRFVLFAAVDPQDQLEEALETNNAARAYVDVRPDPAVVSVAATRIDLSGRDNVQLDVVVRNIGAAPATGATLVVSQRFDGTPIAGLVATLPVGQLAPAEETSLQILVDGLAGDNRYQVRLEPLAAEMSLANNSGIAAVQIPGLPDLIPSDPRVDQAGLDRGDRLRLDFDLENRGIASAEQVLVEVFAGAGQPGDYGVKLGELLVDRVDPLIRETFSVNVGSSLVRDRDQLCVVVDRHEQVLEQSDLNNVVCTPVLVGPAVNDPPSIQILPPGSFDVAAGETVSLSGVTIDDLDAGQENVQLQLSVGHGRLQLRTGTTGGLTTAQVSGNGTSLVRVTAPVAAINATLSDPNGLTYLAPTVPPPNGDETLVLTLDDLGNTGAGGPRSVTASLPIRVATVSPPEIDSLCTAIRSGSDDPRFDLNGDGLVDRSDMRVLIEQILGTTPGDANLDGRFNSTDLIEVFQAGQYEDGIVNNSLWSTGDWNCDGEFDTADLIVAFQAGSYSAAARTDFARLADIAMALLADAADHERA